MGSTHAVADSCSLIGEDKHGGLQWMAEELTKRDVPFASSEVSPLTRHCLGTDLVRQAYSSTEARSLESFLPPPDVLQKQIAAYMEVSWLREVLAYD